MLKRIDLTRDYHKHKAEYMAAIEAVCEETAFSGGRFADEFDKEFARYCHVKAATGVNNGTTALQAAMIALGVGPGDEVIVPSYTFVSSALAFVRQGARIVFADSCENNPNIDPDKIEALITDKTKVIVPVHYAGVACDMDKIMDIAKRHNILVVEDAAQAIDSYYKGKPLGGIGHLGCFSFHETKNVTAGGEGGLLVVNDERFIRRAEIIWEKGTNRAEFFRGIGHILHDMRCQPHLPYSHFRIGMQGFQCRFHLGYAVIHAGQDMAMPVCPALQGTALEQ